MALTPNGLVTISGSPSGGEQPTQNAGATMVDGVIVPAAGFIGIGSGAAQIDTEVFGVAGSARVSNVLAIAGSPIGTEKLYVNGAAYVNGALTLPSSGIGTLIVGDTNVGSQSSTVFIKRSAACPLEMEADATAGGYFALAANGSAKAFFGCGSNIGATTINDVVIRSQSGYLSFQTGGANNRLIIDSSGQVLIGTPTAGASKLVVADDSIQVNTPKTPATAGATGTTGQIAWDANYFYVCVATNTWQRVAHATW